jgi:hypothetical protein
LHAAISRLADCTLSRFSTPPLWAQNAIYTMEITTKALRHGIG